MTRHDPTYMMIQLLQLMIREMEEALSTLYHWFTQNSMKLNSAKTQLLVLGSRQTLKQLPPVTLSVHGAIITESQRVKNLGLVLDKTLSFENHIDQIVGKCTGQLLGLHHARHRLPRDTLKPLVSSLVLSLLRYCITVYGSCSAQRMHRIQKVINFGARVVTGRRKHDRISDAVHDLGWLPARELGTYHSLCLLKRVLLTGEPAGLKRQLLARRDLRDRTTRQDRNLSLPRIRTETGKRSFLYRAVSAYNRLPQAARDGSLARFKRSLKTKMLSGGL